AARGLEFDDAWRFVRRDPLLRAHLDGTEPAPERDDGPIFEGTILRRRDAHSPRKPGRDVVDRREEGPDLLDRSIDRDGALDLRQRRPPSIATPYARLADCSRPRACARELGRDMARVASVLTWSLSRRTSAS